VSKPLPWVKFETLADGGGRFVVAPLERGMGTTIGNAIRRVLLSALPGYAVTSLRIPNVQHEFSSIPGVVEDVLDVIANIKGIIFEGDTEGPFSITLELKKGSVDASQAKLPEGIRILNPTWHIAEVSESQKITIEMVVEKGFGFVASEANEKQDQVIDTINLDASFSPILRVNHQVEHTRVGKSLDFDSLVLDVWSNGSISVEEAVRTSASILMSRFELFYALNQSPSLSETVASTGSDRVKDDAMTLTIDDLELSARSSNCLKRAGIDSVSDLINRDLSDLIQIKNFGKKSADEINAKLKQYGLSLKGTEMMS
jgi:DNA-directed RNA polymerase subunit alpha